MSDPSLAPGSAAGDSLAGRTLSRGQYRFLRYWGLNMTLARRQNQPAFPGFDYDDAEWARLDAVSNGLTTGGIVLWLGAVVLTYFVVAAASVVTVIGGALLTVWKSGNVPEPQIFTAIAVIIGLMIGFAMPLSISFGGLVADGLWRAKPAEAPEDAALYAKVSGQFRRMGLVVGALVLAVMVFWTVLAQFT